MLRIQWYHLKDALGSVLAWVLHIIHSTSGVWDFTFLSIPLPWHFQTLHLYLPSVWNHMQIFILIPKQQQTKQIFSPLLCGATLLVLLVVPPIFLLFFFFNYRGIIDIQLFSSLLKRRLMGCWFQKAETWLLHMSESLCLVKCLACSWHSNICWMNDWLSPFLHSQLVSSQCSCLSHHFSKTSLSKITSDLITKIRACLFILLSLSSP